MEELAGLVLFEPFVLDNIVEELAILHVLHDQEQLLGGFDDLVQLDQVGMPDELEDMDLPEHSLSVGDIVYLAFLQDLYGYIFVG